MLKQPRVEYSIAAPLVALSLLAGRVVAAGMPQGPLDVEPEGLRSGLVAVYRPIGQDGPSLHRIDPKPAFYLGHSSPHPRIPPGGFEVVWDGIIQVNDPGPISFHAFLGGELSVEIDGVTVLRGSGPSDTSQLGPAETLTRPPGHYRLTIRYRWLARVPARLQIHWEGPSFAREPLPAWRLSHLAEETPAAIAREERVARGRDAAGQFGCARCHQGAFPGVTDPPPGPSLADVGRRIPRDWLMRWLDDPAKVRPGAHMPALFASDRQGFVERWILADFLTQGNPDHRDDRPRGDHRAGRLAFLGLGCAVCHFVPDIGRSEQGHPDRVALDGLGDRMSADDLAAFLGNPHIRYPDGRMPRLPIAPNTARDIAAYLLLWAGPTASPPPATAPKAEEVQGLARRLGVSGWSRDATAIALLAQKGCIACHTGLGPTLPRDVPLRAVGRRGCLSAEGMPRYPLDAPTRAALDAYLALAAQEKYLSPVAVRQRQLERAGCIRCHQRDSNRPPPLEEISRSLGGGFLQTIPYQRTPRLTNPHQKLTRAYLSATVREGVSGLHSPDYTYRMPAFGPDAETLLLALAEADGELPAGADPAPRPAVDPTLGTLAGPDLVGSQGYGCISCHVWNGQQLAPADPGAVGPDLTRLIGRVRRDWFDRFLDDPSRSYPGTPMPAIFSRGKRASLASVLDGDSAKQKDALWSYAAQGRHAPVPKPPPPLPITAPSPGAPPLVAQIPIRLPDGTAVEALCLLYGSHDLLIYDLAAGTPRMVFNGGRILRTVQGRTRQFLAAGTPVGARLDADPAIQLDARGEPQAPTTRILHGYDRLDDGARLRAQVRFSAGPVDVEESLRIVRDDAGGRLVRELHLSGIPAGAAVVLRARVTASGTIAATAATGKSESRTEDDVVSVRLTPDQHGTVVASLRSALPPARTAPPWEGKPRDNPDPDPGSLERPGYRAVAFPRPKTVSGEDRIMPGAIAVHPRDGRVFVASLKTGELFVLNDPRGEGGSARFDNHVLGLFQDAFSMLAEEDALYVLHRRNLTRVVDRDGDGVAGRFDRVAGLPHGVADTYDYAYGLVRDRSGGFLLSYAPHANPQLTGSGGVLRLVPGQEPHEVAFGLRNPLGWCSGPEGEVFFTDNQGEWVATNKLCHLEEGRYYGFPNPAQKPDAGRPVERPTVWVPYGWARSINGIAYDQTGGRFGPFAGQFFLAELMFGGAIVRASVERVNGQYQGACFPFWGKGLLGPVCLAFDPKGHLFVGGITEPGWMAQPDRGAVFRIDFTGRTPFEMQSIHALPRGFRVDFTDSVEARSAADPGSFRLERYRYEYTEAYGSPELDRTAVAVERATPSADGSSVELTTPPLVKDRVYLLSAPGVRSVGGEFLVHPTGAYTMNEIPARRE
jgi:cytochrome c551/c552